MKDLRNLSFSLSCIFTILPVLVFSWNYAKEGQDWPQNCINGLQQSPIDIKGEQCDNKQIFTVNFSNTNQTIYIDTINNNIRATVKGSNILSDLIVSNFRGQTVGFDSVQMVIHTPSEHTINGKQYPVELQIVYELLPQYQPLYLQRNIAIVSLLFKEDSSTQSTFTFFSQWNTYNQHDQQELNLKKAFSGLFDGTGKYYHYEGSLTIPDCTENVNWFIFDTPLIITKPQIDKIKESIIAITNLNKTSNNNRPIQNLNQRPILIEQQNCAASNLNRIYSIFQLLILITTQVILYLII